VPLTNPDGCNARVNNFFFASNRTGTPVGCNRSTSYVYSNTTTSCGAAMLYGITFFLVFGTGGTVTITPLDLP
jgi:hypothetical protein